MSMFSNHVDNFNEVHLIHVMSIRLETIKQMKQDLSVIISGHSEMSCKEAVLAKHQ